LFLCVDKIDKGFLAMNLDWEVSTEANGSLVKCAYRAESVAQLDAELELLIIACVDKAVSLMPQNIDDDSQYLLFEFDSSDTLRVVMTDNSKQQESGHRVACDMSALTPYLAQSSYWKFKDERFADIVKYCIRDYLTTCGAFMRYSLVATFSEGDRARTELL
jgi:hypothetical protein